ncbi:MAG TPA: PilZ domain-containing protein [Kofleriaceae bacterium]
MTSFELGQAVELELTHAKRRVAAWVIQVVDAHVWIELQALAPVSAGERVKLVGTGDDGAVWSLDSAVVEVRDPGESGIPLVKISDTGQRVAAQRREYFRVAATLPVALSVIASPNPTRAMGELVAVTTVDLSGGGMQLETDEVLVVGDALELSLELPARAIHVSGTVMRVTPLESSPLRRGSIQLVGVELGPMLERDRAELVRFVHDVERKLRHDR